MGDNALRIPSLLPEAGEENPGVKVGFHDIRRPALRLGHPAFAAGHYFPVFDRFCIHPFQLLTQIILIALIINQVAGHHFAAAVINQIINQGVHLLILTINFFRAVFKRHDDQLVLALDGRLAEPGQIALIQLFDLFLAFQVHARDSGKSLGAGDILAFGLIQGVQELLDDEYHVFIALFLHKRFPIPVVIHAEIPVRDNPGFRIRDVPGQFIEEPAGGFFAPLQYGDGIFSQFQEKREGGGGILHGQLGNKLGELVQGQFLVLDQVFFGQPLFDIGQ